MIIQLKKKTGSIVLKRDNRTIKLIQTGRSGPQGPQGLPGNDGEGVPVGGDTGQVLSKASNADFDTEWVDQSGGGGAVDSVNGRTGAVVLDKTDVGLGNVDNTSDANKPISTATQTALNAKADDSEVVHKTGNETIGGDKLFTDDVEITGNLTMGGNVTLDGSNVIINAGGLLRGYINAIDFAELAPVFTSGTEKGWQASQLRLSGGRFDFDAFEGKAEFRMHGSPQLNVWDTDNSRYMLQIDNDRKVHVFNELNVHSSKITNLLDPTNAQDAATKAYVDSIGVPTSLDDLDDVVITTPTIRQLLFYDPDTQTWHNDNVSIDDITIEMSSISDVFFEDPGFADEQALFYDQDTGMWRQRVITAADITDFDTEVSNNTDVAANTSARHTHANITILNNTTASFTTADETKLDGIESGAEVNNISDVNAADLTDGGDSTLHFHSSDRDRTNHTGTQAISTVTGLQTALDGKVAGPSSATDNAVVRYDGTTGKLVQNSTVTVDDSGNVVVNGNLSMQSQGAAEVPLTVKGAVSQSGRYIEAQNSSATAIAYLNSGGNWYVSNGSTSAVSYGFASEINTGMYRPTSNQIGLVIGGTLRALLTATGLKVTNSVTFNSEVDNGNSSTADTIDWTAGNKQKSTLTGNCTYTFTAPSGPCNVLLKIVQDATGSRTVTWPATVKWPAGTAPTLTTTANAIDIVSFYWDGTNYFGQAGLAFS